MIEQEVVFERKLVSDIKISKQHKISVFQDLYNASCVSDRHTCVMACGTGKTLIAMWHAEQINAKTILVLLPSLGLLNQTLNEWLKNTAIKNFRYLCVCSDQTVDKEEDFLQFMSDDLYFTVTTQSNQVNQFIKDIRSEAVKIIFSTYHSEEVIGLGVPIGFQFDLIIYDEAHKTAGESGKTFSYSLFDNNIESHKRLFLTATPRIINKNQIERRSAKNFVSMDNKELYGDCVHNLNFKKSFLLDIIVDYKVVISVVTSKMVKNILYNSSLKFGEKK